MTPFFQQTAQAMIAKHIDRFPLLKLDQETFAKKSFPNSRNLNKGFRLFPSPNHS